MSPSWPENQKSKYAPTEREEGGPDDERLDRTGTLWHRSPSCCVISLHTFMRHCQTQSICGCSNGVTTGWDGTDHPGRTGMGTSQNSSASPQRPFGCQTSYWRTSKHSPWENKILAAELRNIPSVFLFCYSFYSTWENSIYTLSGIQPLFSCYLTSPSVNHENLFVCYRSQCGWTVWSGPLLQRAGVSWRLCVLAASSHLPECLSHHRQLLSIWLAELHYGLPVSTN